MGLLILAFVGASALLPTLIAFYRKDQHRYAILGLSLGAAIPLSHPESIGIMMLCWLVAFALSLRGIPHKMSRTGKPLTLTYTGITLPDGSVVIGQNKDDLWVAVDASDQPETMTWEQAMAQGDIPTREELQLLWQHRDLIPGGLEAVGIDTRGSFYWSSTEYNTYNAWEQRFSDGTQLNFDKHYSRRVRCAQRFTDTEIQAMLNQDRTPNGVFGRR